MILGMLHVNRRKGESIACRHCDEVINPGDLHALIMLKFGKRGEKAWLVYRRVHLQCLAAWSLVTFMRKSEARAERKGGRPSGTGIALPDEERQNRKRLIRKRAALLRQLVKTDSEEECRLLYVRLKGIRSQIAETGVDLCENMARRSDVSVIRRKLADAQRKV